MKSVLITGANRGIGLKFVDHYCRQNWQVYATYRDEHHALLEKTTQYNHLTLLKVDIADLASIAKLKQSMTGITLDLLINNAATPGSLTHTFGDTSAADIEQWHQVLTINTLAPMLVTEALSKNLQFGTPSKVAFIGSKMGCIADNHSGGSYMVRSSKSALNAVVKSLSVDLKKFGISVVVLHPGWVKTRMGGDNAQIDTKTSVEGMAQVIANLSAGSSGSFIDYDSRPLPW